MEEQLRELHLLGATGTVRSAMLNDRDHLVVPVVMLIGDSVIHAVNADTPEFVPAASLVKAASTWNGRPVVLGHPVRNGRQCSANSPDVMASHGIGTIFNSHIEGKKLLCEAWLDKVRTEQLHPVMYKRLLEGQREEVSVGAHVVTDNVGGNHNGKPYKASWRDTSGDHLAFLPNGRGACSIEMGCGAHRAAAMRVCEDHMEEVSEEEEIEALGGKGSGNFGHSGRPGHEGGSSGTGSGGSLVQKHMDAWDGHISAEEQLTQLIRDRNRELDYSGKVDEKDFKKRATEISEGAFKHTVAAVGKGDSQARPGPYLTHSQEALNASKKGEFPKAIEAHSRAAKVHEKAAKLLDSMSVTDPLKTRGVKKKLKGLGGPGSGFHGHSGRPGERGGSSEGSLSDQHLRAAEIHVKAAEAVEWAASRDGDDSAKADAMKLSQSALSETKNVVGKGDATSRPGPFLTNSEEALTALKAGDFVSAASAHRKAAKVHEKAAKILKEFNVEHHAEQVVIDGVKTTLRVNERSKIRTLFDQLSLLVLGGKSLEEKMDLKDLECPHLETIQTLLDQVGELQKEASNYVDTLLEEESKETDNGDESGEIDNATLEAVQTLCMAASSALSSIITVAYRKMAPTLPQSGGVGVPAYLEAFRAAIGKSISGKNMKTIQQAHDASHDMHAHTTSLGAKCNGMRLLAEEDVQDEYKDCPDCEGTGQVDGKDCPTCNGEGELKTADMKKKDCKACNGTGSVKGNPCEVCNGTGQLKAADSKEDEDTNKDEEKAAELDRVLLGKAAAGAAAFRAACSCNDDKEKQPMTPEQKTEIIKSLVGDKHSGFTIGDEKMLAGASDERLESFRVAAEARKNQETELRAAADKKFTPEEFMAVAPPELKSLITRQQDQEKTMKASLISALKTAQGEYSEAELSVLPVADLQRMARVAKIDEAKLDYSGRGIPRSLASNEEESYVPPDPYAEGLKALASRIN